VGRVPFLKGKPLSSHQNPHKNQEKEAKMKRKLKKW